MSLHEETALPVEAAEPNSVIPVDATEPTLVPPGSLVSEERIPELDLIRGATILGILLININFFMAPSQGMGLQVKHTWWGDDLLAGLILFFVQGKMMSQLGILFGVGLAVQAERARAAGRPFTGYYLRRQFLLLLIGLGHGFLLWYGDILSSYALVAMLALVISWCSLRGLVWWIFGLLLWFGEWVFLLVIALAVYFALLKTGQLPPEWQPKTQAANQRQSPENAAQPNEAESQQVAINGDAPEAAAEVAVYRHGTYGQMVRNRAGHLLQYAIMYVVILVQYYLACFLIGIYLFRRGIFHDREGQVPFLRRLTAWNLGIGIVLHVIVLGFFVAGVVQRTDPAKKDLWEGFAEVMSLLAMLPMAVGYFGLLIFWSRSGRLPRLQWLLRCVGRMALTNYLMQSVLCGLVFYSYGLAQFGQLNLSRGLLVVVAVWALEVAWSPLWFKFFQIGPVEWVWRSLADLRLRPLLRRA